MHVRGLPEDATETDIISICIPFGIVSNVLVLKGKGQGFVQMADEITAATLLTYYSQTPANVRGRTVYFQYSNRQELDTKRAASSDTPNHVILVTVQNMVYPITIDVLYQIFSRYGAVHKIVCFNRNAGFQALIQMDSITSALGAKGALDNQNIYPGCNTLSIQFSGLQQLTVKYNSDKSRDFTNPTLATMGMPGMSLGFGHSMAPLAVPNTNTPVIIASGFPEETTTTDHLFRLFGAFGDVMRVKILFNKKNTALIQFSTAEQADTAQQHLNGVQLFGGQLSVNSSKHPNVSLPNSAATPDAAKLTQDYASNPYHRFRRSAPKAVNPPSAVLHIANLPPTVEETGLREIFSQCGTVAGFKFIPSSEPDKPPMALVQMSSVEEAVNTLATLHLFELGDRAIKVSFTKSTI